MFFLFLIIVHQFGHRIVRKISSGWKVFKEDLLRVCWDIKICHMRRDLLSRAGLCSLELRRLRTDLCICYKILHSQFHLNSFFVMDNVSATRGHSWKIKANHPRLDTMWYFIAYITALVWNALNEETVCSLTLTQFKERLETEDLSAFLTCF